MLSHSDAPNQSLTLSVNSWALHNVMVCILYLRVHVCPKWGQCDHLVIIVIYSITDTTLFVTWHVVVYCLHVVYTRDTTRVTSVRPSGRVTVQCHINVPTFTASDRCVWERSCSGTSTPDSKNNDLWHSYVIELLSFWSSDIYCETHPLTTSRRTTF